ncbi:WYL domain-containing protein [Caulobacter sp. 17J65-9]|uniref:helix-turn-helix transcriptional regulator n=1 Tax=Caulobacter sp. 17J65-9 TaxID=2709382 RepID=UPI0013C931CB|nr:WYL domain-containing protein [Caulobacter sp. 17J65-9]NEX91998.1 WYL domain-containing protein [Caulobacter sp. 17J65-9]
MRASRLLSILMLLQVRGATTAGALAEELEVSVRTVYRDLDELSASGVPVYADRGRNGGVRLLDGYGAKLTGLTLAEAEALFLSGLPGPAEALGLQAAIAAAQLKLTAALPADWRDKAGRKGARVHLDPVGWYAQGDKVEHLTGVAEALWAETRIEVDYESWKGPVRRTLDPLGLVLKAGLWYLVARAGESVRTYRVANMLALTRTDEGFARPAGFDLGAWWSERTQAFEQEIYAGEAVLRVTGTGLARLSRLGRVVAERAASAGPPDADGWRTVSIPIESVTHALGEVMKLGPEAEVLSPPDLRAAIAAEARRLAALYAEAR